MRLDGEAVTVCSLGPGGDWGVGLKKGSLGQCGRRSWADQSWGNAWELEKKTAREADSLRANVNKLSEEGLRGEEEELAQRREQKCRGGIPSRDVQQHCEAAMASRSSRFTVGYALTSKKTNSFLQPKLQMHARDKGIVFVAIDRNRPLEEQGPFDVILHKIKGEDWQQQLEVYSLRHLDVIVLDPPQAIQHLNNRQSMLQYVADLDLRHCRGKVGTPKQLVVTGDPMSIPESVARAGLKLPLVAKPLVIDGTANSHALSLAYNKFCLSELNPPLVLQEFVNHGGVLFKVYVVGEKIRVVRRFSLPDLCEGEPVKHGIIPFPRVSCAAASADGADLDPCVAELPSQELLDSLARELRRRLGLSLFNIDIIREGGKGDHYYVIDINYFPGYGKIPDYEIVFTDFLLSLAESKGK